MLVWRPHKNIFQIYRLINDIWQAIFCIQIQIDFLIFPLVLLAKYRLGSMNLKVILWSLNTKLQLLPNRRNQILTLVQFGTVDGMKGF